MSERPSIRSTMPFALEHRPRAADAPIAVLDLDISRGIDALPCPGYGRALVLARHLGDPIGWVYIGRIDDGAIPATLLRQRIAEQLVSSMAHAVLGTGLRVRSEVAEMPISVVVCTRDRPALLGVCLERLRALDYPSYEIVVVDNAPSSEETARLVSDLPVVYVREDRPGLDWARNRGIARARHDVIAFIDDDARADRGWLRGVARGFAAPEVGAVTGFVAPAELETAAQVLFENVYGGMGKGTQPRSFHASQTNHHEQIAIHAVGVGTNMAFRRRVLDEAGPFDTALDVGTPSRGGGDLDMLHRVLIAGHSIRYEPSAIVWHLHRREASALRRQLASDGRAFGVYLMKRWRSRTVPRFATARFCAYWMAWMLGRLVFGLFGRHELPLGFLSANLIGAVQAPWAYAQTYRNDRRLRASAETPSQAR